ncbi:hypothetical protein TNCV_1826851 [Trichonephila clavipes]|nr:hypothetical protein TNCV_1826851 [Trichonephila clavipes]
MGPPRVAIQASIGSSTICASGPRFMSHPMRSHRCSKGLRSGEFVGQGRMSNTVMLLNVRRVTCAGWHCRVGIPCWVPSATRAEQQAPQFNGLSNDHQCVLDFP